MTVNTIDPNLVAAINLSAKYPSINRMGVFGSHARGEHTAGSDVDIIYDYDDAQIPDMLSCIDEISQLVGDDVDFIAYYMLLEDDLDESEKQFSDSVLSEVVWVYDKSHEVFSS